MTLARNVAVLGILIHLLPKKYYWHVRNAVLDVCAKPVPVWGKMGEWEGYYGEKTYLDMSFDFQITKDMTISSESLIINCSLCRYHLKMGIFGYVSSMICKKRTWRSNGCNGYQPMRALSIQIFGDLESSPRTPPSLKYLEKRVPELFFFSNKVHRPKWPLT